MLQVWTKQRRSYRPSVDLPCIFKDGLGRQPFGVARPLRRFAAWYDEHLAVPFAGVAAALVTRLLGAGRGRCLDLCCGTGTMLDPLCALGWQVTAVDVSADQLEIARERAGSLRVDLVQADAAHTPFPSGHFDVVVSLFSHTDVDDFRGVMREVSRLLAVNGVLVYAGVHPCFVGPHSLERGRAVPALHPGYGTGGRHMDGPISPDGLWAKVGGVHLRLQEVLQAVLDAPLVLERFEEHGDEDYPRRIALRARKPPSITAH